MSNRVSPVGAVVRLYYDSDSQVEVGDVVETRTGRGYQVLGVRVQERGKNAGRQHLQCLVLGGDWLADHMLSPNFNPASRVHRIRWYRRERGAGVVSRRAR